MVKQFAYLMLSRLALVTISSPFAPEKQQKNRRDKNSMTEVPLEKRVQIKHPMKLTGRNSMQKC